MTWLLVIVAWTVCAVVVAPLVGRVLAHGGAVGSPVRRPVHHRTIPTQRNPLVLR